MECELSSIQPKRKRLKSIIKHDKAVKRNNNNFAQYSRIFERVLEIYLDSKRCQPFGSSLILLDCTLRSSFKRWTPDTAHSCIDFENAVSKALENEPELQAKFEPWFLCFPDERTTVPASERWQYNKIITKCAREFLRRGMFPIHKWFRAPERDFYNATITEG
jgi:hypothetical protein